MTMFALWSYLLQRRSLVICNLKNLFVWKWVLMKVFWHGIFPCSSKGLFPSLCIVVVLLLGWQNEEDISNMRVVKIQLSWLCFISELFPQKSRILLPLTLCLTWYGDDGKKLCFGHVLSCCCWVLLPSIKGYLSTFWAALYVMPTTKTSLSFGRKKSIVLLGNGSLTACEDNSYCHWSVSPIRIG